jgi:thiol-disulfide isomerase/thioredoxin
VGIRGWVTLLAACLCVTGCSLFGKKSASTTPSGPRTPDSNTAPQFPTRERPSAEPVSTVSQANGVLAGQILDRYNRRPANVYIRVVDLEDTRDPKAAPIEKQADEQGYFTIAGLRPGGHYQLAARGQDGDRVFSGTLLAIPPNPRLTIWVGDDGSAAPVASQQQSVYPGRADADGRPAASLEAPVRDAPAPITQNPASPTSPTPNPNTPAPPSSTPGSAAPAATPDPSRTADRPPVKDGFEQSSPKVNVPGPGEKPADIGTPPGTPKPPSYQSPQRPPDGNSGPTSQAPAESPPVPSCQLVGKRLINLALYDEKGSVWEFRKSRSGQGRYGRLVLIDFWRSQCGPCLVAMKHMVELNQQYGPYGLDVVSIGYVSGTAEQQEAQVRSVRGRYGIRYPTLVGAGNNCPVRTQFDVQAYPTIVLLDENGDIILRKEGLSDRDASELKFEIHRRLLASR